MSAPSLGVSRANLRRQRIGGAAFCALLLAGIGGPSGAGQSSTDEPYQVVDVQAGGAISGTVTWSGPVPKIPRLPITKDPKICDPAGETTRDLQRLIIGPGGGVANTVVYPNARAPRQGMGSAVERADPRSAHLCLRSSHLTGAGGRRNPDQEQRSDPAHRTHDRGSDL